MIQFYLSRPHSEYELGVGKKKQVQGIGQVKHRLLFFSWPLVSCVPPFNVAPTSGLSMEGFVRLSLWGDLGQTHSIGRHEKQKTKKKDRHRIKPQWGNQASNGNFHQNTSGGRTNTQHKRTARNTQPQGGTNTDFSVNHKIRRELDKYTSQEKACEIDTTIGGHRHSHLARDHTDKRNFSLWMVWEGRSWFTRHLRQHHKLDQLREPIKDNDSKGAH